MIEKILSFKSTNVEKITLLLMGIYLFVLNFSHVMTIRQVSFFLAIILAAFSLSRNHKWEWSPLKVPFIFWIVIALTSLSVSNDVWYSLSEIKKEVVYYILSFWLFFVMTKNRKDFIFLSKFVLISATLLITASLYYYYILGLSFGNLTDKGILYGKPNYFSVYMSITSVLCLAIALLKNTSKALRCYSFLLLPLSILTIYFTRHRAGYFSLITVVFIGFLILMSKLLKLISYKKKGMLFLLILLFILPLAIFTFSKGLTWSEGFNVLSNLKESESARYRLINFSIEKITQQPLLGTGFGNKFFNIPALDGRNYYPHNLFFSYGVMLGIPGIIVLTTLIGKIFSILRANLNKFFPTEQFCYIVSVSGILILVSFIILNLTDDAMVRHSGLFFWSIMGMILGSSSSLSKTKPYALQVRMKASVILTAWNESQRQLNNCLDGISLSADHVCETIVLVNKYEKAPKKTEDILKLVSTHPNITRWVNVSQNIGVARAWNVGVNICDGDIFIILNGDCVLHNDALEKLLEPLSNKFIGIVGVGGVRDGKKVKTKGLCENIHGFCFAIRKETYKEIGGFENEFSSFSDDEEFCARALEKGWGVYIAEGVNYTHKYSLSKKPEEEKE